MGVQRPSPHGPPSVHRSRQPGHAWCSAKRITDRATSMGHEWSGGQPEKHSKPSARCAGPSKQNISSPEHLPSRLRPRAGWRRRHSDATATRGPSASENSPSSCVTSRDFATSNGCLPTPVESSTCSTSWLSRGAHSQPVPPSTTAWMPWPKASERASPSSMTRPATPTAAVWPKSTMTSRRPPGPTTSVASNSPNTTGTTCVAELARAVGLGGRHRSVGGTAERARTSVTRSLRYALGRLAPHHPALATHLEQSVHTGTYCVYTPDPLAPIRWHT